MSSLTVSMGFFKSRTTVLPALNILCLHTLLPIVSNVAVLDSIIIFHIHVAMMAFIPLFCYLCSNLYSSFTTSATVVFWFIKFVSSKLILIWLEGSIFLTHSCSIKFKSPLSTALLIISFRFPTNSIVALIVVVSLWPIPLAFDVVSKRWLVNVILLLF